MNRYGLVRIRNACPGIREDLRYRGSEHFFKRPLYEAAAEAWLLSGSAAKLADCQRMLAGRGLGLLVLDAYRPLAVQALMWEILPDDTFVAPPSRGSIHNRGAAVDLSLIDREGRELPMPSAFDEFSERASHDYAAGSEEALKNRDTLRAAMEAAGFRAYTEEWWHYSDPELRSSPLLEVSFEELAALD